MDYPAFASQRAYQHDPRNFDRYIANVRAEIRRERQLKERRDGLRKRFGKISKRMARRFKKYRRFELFVLWDPTFDWARF